MNEATTPRVHDLKINHVVSSSTRSKAKVRVKVRFRMESNHIYQMTKYNARDTLQEDCDYKKTLI